MVNGVEDTGAAVVAMAGDETGGRLKWFVEELGLKP